MLPLGSYLTCPLHRYIPAQTVIGLTHVKQWPVHYVNPKKQMFHCFSITTGRLDFPTACGKNRGVFERCSLMRYADIELTQKMSGYREKRIVSWLCLLFFLFSRHKPGMSGGHAHTPHTVTCWFVLSTTLFLLSFWNTKGEWRPAKVICCFCYFSFSFIFFFPIFFQSQKQLRATVLDLRDICPWPAHSLNTKCQILEITFLLLHLLLAWPHTYAERSRRWNKGTRYMRGGDTRELLSPVSLLFLQFLSNESTKGGRARCSTAALSPRGLTSGPSFSLFL